MSLSLAAIQRIGQELRQYDFDFDPPPQPPATPPRLLMLACSATKKRGAASAREMYDGPLWQTLRSVDPDASRAWVAFLSARFGLGCASAAIPAYDAVLSARSASKMAADGIYKLWPEIALTQKTAAGRARAIASAPPRFSARSTVQTIVNQLQQPIADVAVCGGRHYAAVAMAYIADLRGTGLIRSDASVTVINDQIGYMRVELRKWLLAEGEYGARHGSQSS